MGCYYSRLSKVATKRGGGVDSKDNINTFMWAKEATTYDNLLLDGRISNADVRTDVRTALSGLHMILGVVSSIYTNIDTDILISYLLTCDPPADVNGKTSSGYTPMRLAAYHNNTIAVKVLIDFGGDRTIKTNSDTYTPNMTPLDMAKVKNNQEIIQLLTECFPSEE